MIIIIGVTLVVLEAAVIGYLGTALRIVTKKMEDINYYAKRVREDSESIFKRVQ